MRAAVLTISDGVARGEREDKSGDILDELLRADGFEVERLVVADEPDEISTNPSAFRPRRARARPGTGVAPRDVTVRRGLIDREVPGIPEAIRAVSAARTPHGLLSRESPTRSAGRWSSTCPARRGAAVTATQ